jgi:hypothetical protein
LGEVSQVSLLSFCKRLSETPVSIFLRDAPYPYPILLIVHVISIAVFGGMVFMCNLRVLGIAMKRVPVSQVIEQWRGWKWLAFAILLVTGTLLAMSDPLEYYSNVMFWISLGLLLAVGVDAAIFRNGIYQTVATWDDAVVTPASARRWPAYHYRCGFF